MEKHRTKHNNRRPVAFQQLGRPCHLRRHPRLRLGVASKTTSHHSGLAVLVGSSIVATPNLGPEVFETSENSELQSLSTSKLQTALMLWAYKAFEWNNNVQQIVAPYPHRLVPVDSLCHANRWEIIAWKMLM